MAEDQKPLVAPEQATEQPVRKREAQDYKNVISQSKLLDAGAHLGLATRRWNPEMKPFIKGRKGPIHVIDVQTTVKQLEKAYEAIAEDAGRGGKVMFVGTKDTYIKAQIREQAKRAGGHYVNQRWLGGTLTNFKMISNSIRRLNDLVALDQSGGLARYTKKEQVKIHKQINRLINFVGGIRAMRVLPTIVVVVDPVHESNAVAEARKLGIFTIAITNTNGAPDDVDLAIPANTESIRSVALLLQLLADAVVDGTDQPLLVARRPDEEIPLLENPRPKPSGRAGTRHRANFDKPRFNRFGPPPAPGAGPSSGPSSSGPRPFTPGPKPGGSR